MSDEPRSGQPSRWVRQSPTCKPASYAPPSKSTVSTTTHRCFVEDTVKPSVMIRFWSSRIASVSSSASSSLDSPSESSSSCAAFASFSSRSFLNSDLLSFTIFSFGLTRSSNRLLCTVMLNAPCFSINSFCRAAGFFPPATAIPSHHRSSGKSYISTPEMIS